MHTEAAVKLELSCFLPGLVAITSPCRFARQEVGLLSNVAFLKPVFMQCSSVTIGLRELKGSHQAAGCASAA